MSSRDDPSHLSSYYYRLSLWRGPYRFPVFRAIIADKSVSAMVNSGLQPFSPQLNMCTYVSMLYIYINTKNMYPLVN